MAGDRRALVGKLLRYSAGSVVATVCSEVTLLALYGWLGVAAGLAAVFAWLAGAIPNYWLNRAWTWGRQGRPSMRRELVPYIVIVLGTLLLAVLATSLVDRLARQADISDGLRTTLVGVTFLMVYAVMFLVRFVLFDRLFSSQDSSDEPLDSTALS
jgi:putative flippase GtrA